MRIFTNPIDVFNEVARDLQEMGIPRATQTMQDKHIAGNPDFETVELQNYSFGITRPTGPGLIDILRLPGFDRAIEEYAMQEFFDRTEFVSDQMHSLNPGRAYKLRPHVWEKFLEGNGKFSYSYSERLSDQFGYIIRRLREDPGSRQCIASIWDPTKDIHRLGKRRVPCSLYYHFISYKSGELSMIYAMRSCDFVTHMPVDVFLACKILAWMANWVGMKVDKFYMNISSLHYYRKDEELVQAFMRGDTNEND